MKILEVHVTPIAISDPPLLNAAGLHAPFALRTIVEIVTDNGLYGLGEVPGGARITAALEQARETIIGQSPFALNAIRAALQSRFEHQPDARGQSPWDKRTHVHVLSAIEVACFDLMGKVTGRPVVDLLGGKARDKVEFSAYLFYKYEGAGGTLGFNTDANAKGWAAARQAEALDPEGIVKQAKAMCETYGFKSIKLKGGVFPPEQEVEAMFALREAFPETPLRLDPNAVWSLETAIKWGKELEGVLEYYEDPVRGQEAMAQLRQAIKLPLATNMCTTAFEHLPKSLALHSEDIILSDHHFWGGLRATVELARICKVFGRGMSMHSNSHIGVSLAAMVHVAAASAQLSYACDTHYPWQYEDIVTQPLKFENGAITVPDKPGLGVELNREMLAKLHEQYLACGLKERDDALAMQAKQLGWGFKETRW
jgi:glucarate dehydratase